MAVDLTLGIRLAQSQDRDDIKTNLALYATQLCEDLGLPVKVVLLLDTLDQGAASHSELFRIFVNGQACRLRWWPQPVLPEKAPAGDVVTLVASSLYESREFLLTREIADLLAGEWKVSQGGKYSNEWSPKGFHSFLQAFVRYNHSLKHAREFVEKCKKGATSESEAAERFEQAIEEASDLELGPAVTLCEDDLKGLEMAYEEKLRLLIRQVEGDLGVVLRDVQIKSNFESFQKGDLQIKLNGVRLPKVRGLAPGEKLLLANEADLKKLNVSYLRLLNPVAGSYSFCRTDYTSAMEKLESVSVWRGGSPDYLKDFLGDVLRANAGSFLGSPIIYLLIDKENLADLARDVGYKFGGPSVFYRKLTAALRRLLDERISIRDLAGILESLSSLIEERDDNENLRVFHYSQLADSPLLVANARGLQDLEVAELAFAARLGVRSLAVKYVSDKGKQIFGFREALPESHLELLARVAIGVTWATLRTRPSLDCDLAIIVKQSLRTFFKDRLRFEFPTVAVLGASEIPRELIGVPPEEIEKDSRPLDLQPVKLRDRRSLARHSETAIPRIHQALTRLPRDIDVRVAAAVSDFRAGRTPEGATFLNEAAAFVENNPDWQRTLGRGYYAAGRALSTNMENEKAREMFLKALALDPKVPIYHYDLAQNYDELGQLADAENEYNEAARLSYNDARWQATIADVFYNRGQSFYGAGAYRKAMKAYRQAVHLAPETSAYHAWLAYALTRQGDYLTDSGPKNEHYKEAVVEYRRAIAIDDQFPWYYQYLSQSLAKLGKLDEAGRAFQLALELDPSNMTVRRESAGCLTLQGRFQDALDVLLGFPPGTNKSADYLVDLANAYAIVDRYPDAVRVAKSIERTASTQEPLYDRWLEALGQLANSPRDPERHQMLAQVYTELYKYSMAVAEYQKAIEKLDTPELRKLLGNALYKGNDLAGAAEEWEKVLVQEPKDAFTINNLGTAYDGLGRLQEAIAQYALARKLQPKNFIPLYNLGSANYRLAKMLEAQQAYEQAKSLNQKFAPTYYHLGNCHYRLGDSDTAQKEWEAAVWLDSKFSEAQFNLGVVLWNSGKRDDARKKWQDALDSDPNFAAAEDNIEAEKKGVELDLEIRDLNRGR